MLPPKEVHGKRERSIEAGLMPPTGSRQQYYNNNIGNRRVQGAIDIGATRSSIGRELANRIATHGTQKRVAEAIRLTDGTNGNVT